MMNRVSCFLLKQAMAMAVISAGLLGVTHANAGSAETSALRLQRVTDLPANTAPSTVPRDYVVTPNGYFPSECVHEIKRGERLLSQSTVLGADGATVRQEPACTRPHYTKQGQRVDTAAGIRRDAGSDAAGVKPASGGGWYEAVTYVNGSAGTRQLSANWTVPSAPSVENGQVVFFFPGLTQSNYSGTILQPVLQWNEFGNNSWQFSSWNCCGADGSGTINYSTPIDVNVGDQLYGLMSQNCAVGSSSCDSWNIVSTDQTTGQSTALQTGGSNTGSSGQVYNWIDGAVLEAYGVTACNQFPADGSLHFSSISAYDANNHAINPDWSASANGIQYVTSPACHYTPSWTATDNWLYYR
ncbi:hypothetical protein [Burkholderia alba]|uniref:hypothetical protein n=1 Tax=Burkholderia alba TaxID=2683677 RepID=UPI002B05C826|nr:hypothetical protein [Burkholderia alba]